MLTPAHLKMAKANFHHFDFVGFVDDDEGALARFERIYGRRPPSTG